MGMAAVLYTGTCQQHRFMGTVGKKFLPEGKKKIDRTYMPTLAATSAPKTRGKNIYIYAKTTEIKKKAFALPRALIIYYRRAFCPEFPHFPCFFFFANRGMLSVPDFVPSVNIF